jgi:hypothetical protein
VIHSKWLPRTRKQCATLPVRSALHTFRAGRTHRELARQTPGRIDPDSPSSSGDPARALGLFEEALEVSRDAGLEREIAWNLLSLAANQMNVDPPANLEPLLEESIAAGRASGDLSPVISAMWTLDRLYRVHGDMARARGRINEALMYLRSLRGRPD